MRGRLFCFVTFVVVLQIVNWVCVTSRPFAPSDGHVVPQPGTVQSSYSLQVTLGPKEGSESMEGEREMKEASSSTNNYKGVNSKIGSSPPSCEDKCFGCRPCEAIQVPTTTSHFGVQYTNYEPEDWKCKCGSAFYTP